MPTNRKTKARVADKKEPIVCPDCGWVKVEHDVFQRDALGRRIGVSGECPKCGDRLYYAPPDDGEPNHGQCSACGFPNKPDGCCSRPGCCNSD